MPSENIVAISTGLVASGIAVIRISGDSALQVAEKMFSPSSKIKVSEFEPYRMYTGRINCDNFSDFGMCVYFRAPRSFTGEDVVEFHSHGGTAIASGIVKQAIKFGCRPATRGEFTRRAFINGKLSLSSCEGMIDMINSETESGVKAGFYLYREKLSKKVEEMQKKLTDALCEIEADVDFPEEDLEVDSRNTARKLLAETYSDALALLKTFSNGRMVKNGVKVGIVGKPNTGKSSLLNALVGYDKAIVSSVAGTTRDVVEGSFTINGVKFILSDTAGIRDSADEIEKIGVERSSKILEESDVILFVIDGSASDEDERIKESVRDKNVITVLNKCDSVKTAPKGFCPDAVVSALDKINLDGLRDAIFDRTIGKGQDLNGDFLCEERHKDAIGRACDSLASALGNIDEVPLDMLSVDVKDAWSSLGEITGTTATEEVINEIFSKFCVGK